ncbi:MAG: hypothetical protein ACKPKO_21895, partial [Candidatus Fonsibacter sp.]
MEPLEGRTTLDTGWCEPVDAILLVEKAAPGTHLRRRAAFRRTLALETWLAENGVVEVDECVNIGEKSDREKDSPQNSMVNLPMFP